MNSNVISKDTELVQKSDGLYGEAKIDYMAFVIGMCGAPEALYENSDFDEVNHKKVAWTLSQRFPQDEFLVALKSTQTELAQVHGKPTEFQYSQYPYGIEFIYKKAKGYNADSIKAQTIKEMLKSWDTNAFNGDGVNQGITNNDNAETNSQAWAGDYTTLKTAVDAIVLKLRNATDITSSDYGNVQIGYDSNVYNVINQTDTNNVSNLERLQKSYPGIVFVEIPSNLVKKVAGEGYLTGAYRPMLRMHRASLPSIEAVASGKYGKSEDTLFGAESCAVEVEVKGALQLMELTPTTAYKTALTKQSK